MGAGPAPSNPDAVGSNHDTRRVSTTRLNASERAGKSLPIARQRALLGGWISATSAWRQRTIAAPGKKRGKLNDPRRE